MRRAKKTKHDSRPTRFRSLVALAGLACVWCASLPGWAGPSQVPPALYQEMRWRMIGPFRGGRTRAAAGVPGQPNVFYVGQVNGGVWKSDDYGRTWTPIFDDQPTQSIGAIAVAPSNPSILYVASGEGLQRPDLSVGDGIYKSTDAGKTWIHLGLRDGQQIPQLAVDPGDPDRLFAAVLGHPFGANPERGIFRSTDGGQTWQKVLFVNERIGGSDVQVDPSHPNVVYASLCETRRGPWEDNNSYVGTGGGLFKSIDGGSTWSKLTQGLPPDVVQINLAIAPSNPQRLYATLATLHDLGIYRSDDAGKSWYPATTDSRPAVKIGGGDLPVPKVDPKDPDVVYTASTVAWRSRDGGKTWTAFRGAPGGDDYQNLWINPTHPDIILLVSDQGAIVSVNGGASWSSWYNQPTAQLYHAIATDEFPYRVCAGQQESGSVCISSRGNDGQITVREWHPVGVIEYGYVAPDPLHPGIIYGAGRNEVSRFDGNTGQVQNVTPIPVRTGQYRTNRTQPILFSPVNPHLLYSSANVIFQTTDGGNSWQIISPDLTREHPGIPPSLGTLADKDPYARKVRGVVYSLAASFKTVATLWAGTDDGLIWVTRDGGKNWKNVTPPQLAPWSKVTQIAASRFDDYTAYASISRFRVDDLRPAIYRTHDGGKSWKSIVQGLPDDAPVDTVREDPVRRGLLFAGTEKAVWVSWDDGDHWQSLQLNLPHTSMRDLWIHDNDLIVATHGRSLWILDDITPLRQIDETVEQTAAHLFDPAPAMRVRRNTNTDTPLPPDEPTAQNPPDGAILDYWLSRAASGPVLLEILDANGRTVRRFSSADPPGASEEDLKSTAAVPLYWIRPPRILSGAAGMHRWVWDLREPAPKSEDPDYPISAILHDTPLAPLGPMVLPGEYSVRLEVGGERYTAPLSVSLDPRVKSPLAGLREEYRVETQLVSLINDLATPLAQARSVSADCDKVSKQAGGATAGKLESFCKQLTSVLGASGGFFAPVPPEPALDRVSGQLAALYEAISGVDAAPTVSQLKALAQIERDIPGLMQRWNQIKTVELPGINRRLKGSALPELKLEPEAALPGHSQNEE